MTKTIEVQEVSPLETLRNTIFEMDSELGAIGCRIETLSNIESTLGLLKVKMDNVKEEDIRFHFRDYHRTVNMLSDLMSYSMKDLHVEFDEAYELCSSMSESIKEIERQKNPSSGKTKGTL